MESAELEATTDRAATRFLRNFNLKSECMAALVYPAHGPRHQETFPELKPQEIDRLRRFGALRKFSDGEKLYEAGKVAPGMFVVLKGLVSITQRDGLGHVAPVVEEGRATSWPKSASSPAARRWSTQRPRATSRPC